MSKFYGYDEAMENDIAKITTPKLALMSDVVASDKKFIRMENGSLTVIAGVLIAVGNSVFKTEKTTLTASNLDGTATKFEVGKDYCIYICDPTGGDATNFAAEQYRISLNTTYPNGYTAVYGISNRQFLPFHKFTERNHIHLQLFCCIFWCYSLTVHCFLPRFVRFAVP